MFGGTRMPEDKGGADVCSDGHTPNYLYKPTITLDFS